jgi:phospholipid/cholesterol/gamma-HCH transport system substrate-binding protein
MLTSLDRLSHVATDVVHRSHDDLVHDLYGLEPTLRELNRTGQSLPNSLQILATPPFVDSAVDASHGQYMNLDLELDLNLQDLLNNALNASTPLAQVPDPGSLLPPALGGLLTLPQKSSSSSGSSSTGGLLPGLGGN